MCLFFISFPKLFSGFFGNLATDLWFIPLASNYLHLMRGVKFKKFSNVYFARGVIIDNSHPQSIYIGSNVVFAPRSSVIAHSFIPSKNFVVSHTKNVLDVVICDNVFIGLGSIILPGSYISSGSYVAAGLLVLQTSYCY